MKLLATLMLFAVVIKAQVYNVAVNHFPPWVIIEGTNYSGIDIEALELIGEKLKIKFRYTECPFRRCLLLMEKGTADIMTGLFKREEREKYMYFLNPHYYDDPPKVFYLKNDAKFKIENYEDLKGLKIGVVKGEKYFSRFDDDPALIKIEITKHDQLIGMLNLGRIDTFIGTSVFMDYLIAKDNLRGKFKKATLQHQQGGQTYMAISKKSKLMGIKSDIEAVIAEAKSNGVFEKISDQFIMKQQSSSGP